MDQYLSAAQLEAEISALPAGKADLLISMLSKHHPDIAAKSTKAAAIMRGVDGHGATSAPTGWLADLKAWKVDNDPEAAYRIKALLGSTSANGAAIAPANAVASIQDYAGRANPWRSLITYRTVNAGFGVDIPYVTDVHQNALLQGAFGSNKDNRDVHFATESATLFTIAQIVDVSNQLLEASAGAAEAIVLERIGTALGMAEGAFITNGTGSGQPLGILQAIMDYGDIAATKYTLNSESRAAALANGMAKLEAYNRKADAVVVNPTTYYAIITETLGSSGSGGWAVSPAEGPTGQITTIWGVPLVRDSAVPVGTALVGNFRRFEAYVTGNVTIDVTREAGNRWDQNVSGWRGELGFAFSAEPFVRTGCVIKVLGL